MPNQKFSSEDVNIRTVRRQAEQAELYWWPIGSWISNWLKSQEVFECEHVTSKKRWRRMCFQLPPTEFQSHLLPTFSRDPCFWQDFSQTRGVSQSQSVRVATTYTVNTDSRKIVDFCIKKISLKFHRDLAARNCVNLLKNV